jgi:hypothetical protein
MGYDRGTFVGKEKAVAGCSGDPLLVCKGLTTIGLEYHWTRECKWPVDGVRLSARGKEWQGENSRQQQNSEHGTSPPRKFTNLGYYFLPALSGNVGSYSKNRKQHKKDDTDAGGAELVPTGQSQTVAIYLSRFPLGFRCPE